MATVLQVGAGMTAMRSGGSVHGGVVCSTSAPCRIVCDCTSSSAASATLSKAAFPTCRGLKIVKSGGSAKRLPLVTVIGYGQTFSGKVVCEKKDATIGAASAPEMVTEDTFQKEVLESKIPVLVDFWAPWCGPCRMISPVIDELAKTYAGKLKCLKLNTDDCPHIATEYGIRSIPTVMIFKKGEKKDTVIGAVPKNTLAATVEKYID